MNDQVTEASRLDLVLALLKARYHPEAVTLDPTVRLKLLPALELAGRHGITPALAEGLRAMIKLGLPWIDLLPFIEAIESSNAAKNDRLYKSSLRAARCLSEAGINAVFLKGSAVILEDDKNSAWRPLTDLDLLVSEHDVERSASALIKLGYRKLADHDGFKDGLHHHYPPLYDETTATLIELHIRTMQDASSDPLTPAQIFDNAITLSHQAAPVLIPCPNHRMIHLIAHAQISNWGYVLRQMTLKDAVDAAELNARHNIDWDVVTEAFKCIKAEVELESFLHTVNTVLGPVVPEPRGDTFKCRQWGNVALNSLRDTKAKPADSLRIFAHYLKRFAQNPSRLRLIFKTLRNPDRLTQLLNINRGRVKSAD